VIVNKIADETILINSYFLHQRLQANIYERQLFAVERTASPGGQPHVNASMAASVPPHFFENHWFPKFGEQHSVRRAQSGFSPVEGASRQTPTLLDDEPQVSSDLKQIFPTSLN
jgi:hypothetical protein